MIKNLFKKRNTTLISGHKAHILFGSSSLTSDITEPDYNYIAVRVKNPTDYYEGTWIFIIQVHKSFLSVEYELMSAYPAADLVYTTDKNVIKEDFDFSGQVEM